MPNKSVDAACGWAGWRPGAVPCRFTPEQAEANCRYLLATLGAAWVRRGVTGAGEKPHPVIRAWRWPGPHAFLSLNTLAEDLRVLEGAPGLGALLDDLRSTTRAPGALHAIHSAALLTRGGAAVERFFAQTDATAPDYLLRAGSQSVVVEAKALAQSDVEHAFGLYAQRLADRLGASVLPLTAMQPVIHVVVKDPHYVPDAARVVAAVREGLARYGAAWHYRSSAFNVFVRPPPPNPALSAFRSIHILSPRSPRENLRTQRVGKDASQQLRAEATGVLPGLLHLALGKYQDPREVRELFRAQFARGRFSGMGGVLLSRSHMQAQPPAYTPVDAVEWVANVRAAHPVPTAGLTFGPVGVLAGLSDRAPQAPSVLAYRLGMVQGRLSGHLTDGHVGLTPIEHLTPEMLA